MFFNISRTETGSPRYADSNVKSLADYVFVYEIV